MRLKKIKYEETLVETDSWHLDQTELMDINLIVGRNATGKTRVINVVSALASALSGKAPQLFTGTWDVQFEEVGHTYEYSLRIAGTRVVSERLTHSSEVLLDRGKDGVGKIRFSKIGNDLQDFQSPDTQLAVFSRNDKIQHPYLDALTTWGRTLRTYRFGTPFGNNNYQISAMNAGKSRGEDDTNPDFVAAVFQQGTSRGQQFKDSVISDMREIGYHIKDIGLAHPEHLLSGNNQINALWVREVDLPGRTYQTSMSAGMWRSLALIINMNVQKYSPGQSTVLIDDIGEGLDFERSKFLVNLLISKARARNFQLIMTTNDRFVMNEVPLEFWAVATRKSNRVSIINSINAKEKFDEFKTVGLSNFDFFKENMRPLKEVTE